MVEEDSKHHGHPTALLVGIVVRNAHVSLYALMNLLFNMEKVYTIRMRKTLFQFPPDVEGIFSVYHNLSNVS